MGESALQRGRRRSLGDGRAGNGTYTAVYSLTPPNQDSNTTIMELTEYGEMKVKYANKHNIPFLAISGTHGSTTAISTLTHGIQINLRHLNALSSTQTAPPLPSAAASKLRR
jgi:hypothetical protein